VGDIAHSWNLTAVARLKEADDAVRMRTRGRTVADDTAEALRRVVIHTSGHEAASAGDEDADEEDAEGFFGMCVMV
jgi:hypothetical protein